MMFDRYVKEFQPCHGLRSAAKEPPPKRDKDDGSEHTQGRVMPGDAPQAALYLSRGGRWWRDRGAVRPSSPKNKPRLISESWRGLLKSATGHRTDTFDYRSCLVG